MPSSKHHFPLSQPEKPCFLPLIYLFYFNSNCPLDLHFSIPRTMIYLRSCLVLKTKNHPVACWYMFHNRFPMKKLILNVIVYTMVDSSTTLISLNRKLGTDMQNLLLGVNANCPQHTTEITFFVSSIFISHIWSFTKFHKFPFVLYL